MKRNILLSLILVVAVGMTAGAHDFTATVGGQTIYLNIVSQTDHTAILTYMGSRADHAPSALAGDVILPATVQDGSTTYRIIGIGAKAFAGAGQLTGITLPAGVTSIGDFAFEGCTALSRVVFPGGEVRFGQGTFFGCTALSELSLGSDWTAVDLAMFRWSRQLTTLYIPAKVTRIQNLKRLKALQSITVDANNQRFAAVDGVLYNKDLTTLYAVPRAYSGALAVADSTRTVAPGALIDCTAVTSIDLPASLRTISFRETSRLTALQTVHLRAETPLTNAYRGGIGYFALQLASPNVRIIVPAAARKAYQAALPTEAGEYTESAAAGSTPYTLAASELPTAKQIKGEK